MNIIYNDIALSIEYSYEEQEPGSYDYPGSPDSAEIESVKVKDVDIYDLLSIEQLYEIEGIILNKIRNNE